MRLTGNYVANRLHDFRRMLAWQVMAGIVNFDPLSVRLLSEPILVCSDDSLSAFSKIRGINPLLEPAVVTLMAMSCRNKGHRNGWEIRCRSKLFEGCFPGGRVTLAAIGHKRFMVGGLVNLQPIDKLFLKGIHEDDGRYHAGEGAAGESGRYAHPQSG